MLTASRAALQEKYLKRAKIGNFYFNVIRMNIFSAIQLKCCFFPQVIVSSLKPTFAPIPAPSQGHTPSGDDHIMSEASAHVLDGYGGE